jgi:uncharacterized OsmC-like protein
MKINISWMDDFGFKADVRQFKNILLDEPQSFKGSDRGPSPVEYILLGIGGCLGASFIHCCKINNLKIKRLELIVDGKMTHNQPYNHLELVNVNTELNIIDFKGKKDEDLEKCINNFKHYCVVTNSLIRGLPIDVKVNY